MTDPGPPEFPHGPLSRTELASAARFATWAAQNTRGHLAASWRHLATALQALADQRHPARSATTNPAGDAT